MNRRSTLAQSKDAERLVAERLGGKRRPSSGLADQPDVEGDTWVAEVKHRNIPAWILTAMAQADRASECAWFERGLSRARPLLVLVDKPGPGKTARMLVVQDWRDFVDYNGRADD